MNGRERRKQVVHRSRNVDPPLVCTFYRGYLQLGVENCLTVIGSFVQPRKLRTNRKEKKKKRKTSRPDRVSTVHAPRCSAKSAALLIIVYVSICYYIGAYILLYFYFTEIPQTRGQWRSGE